MPKVLTPIRIPEDIDKASREAVNLELSKGNEITRTSVLVGWMETGAKADGYLKEAGK